MYQISFSLMSTLCCFSLKLLCFIVMFIRMNSVTDLDPQSRIAFQDFKFVQCGGLTQLARFSHLGLVSHDVCPHCSTPVSYLHAHVQDIIVLNPLHHISSAIHISSASNCLCVRNRPRKRIQWQIESGRRTRRSI